MTRPRLLDLFAGAQGAAVGYARAGFEVHAVDIERHDRHPEVASFITADALEVLEQVGFCRMFDVIAGSPPCQRYSTQTRHDGRDRHPDLIAPTRDRMRAIGRPYVIENVSGARRHLDHPLMLCGSSFGLGVRRHRYFEAPDLLLVPPPRCDHAERPWTVTGDHPDGREHRRPDGTLRGRKPTSLEHAREVMGNEWMSWGDLTESIPWRYTEWIGRRLLERLGERADGAA